MSLIRITELTDALGITSRSLRYYEQAGLVSSVRSDSEKYRYYDAENIERLKQIMVLRKMQIPIKTNYEESTPPPKIFGEGLGRRAKQRTLF